MSNRNFLRLIIVISLIAVVSLSCFSIFFLSPSFTNLIIKNTELEAVKIGQHLAEPFQGLDKITRDLPPGFIETVKRAVSDFGLMKIKVFAPDGETVYSSSGKDIGIINNRDYFHDIVAKGKPYTKVVNKNAKSLEDQVVTEDVVETYVPVMNGGNFAGAFEIYFDITTNKNELENLLFNSNLMLLLIASALMLAVLIISFIARRSFIKQEQAEKKIMQQRLDLQERNRELSVLNDISRVLSRSIELKTLLPLVLETIVSKLPVFDLDQKGGILLIEGEKMELAAHLGHDEKFISLHKDLTINDCLCGEAARSGEIIISLNSLTDPRHTICCDTVEPHGHIIVPLKSAEKVVGVLCLYLPADIEMEEIKINLLESMASQVGMAIDNARLYGKTRKMALHDPLTGLANRRLMDIKLQQAISLAERYDSPLCVAMLDIDFFKNYNDTRGHDAGDKVLARVAEKISAGIRKSDIAARYGGEEFLVILPESHMSDARLAVERIRRDIAENLEVTISGGITLFQKGTPAAKLVKAADNALYKAKRNGRNRVECD